MPALFCRGQALDAFLSEYSDNMGKGKNISMETLVRICETLNCGILDVIELEKEDHSVDKAE